MHIRHKWRLDQTTCQVVVIPFFLICTPTLSPSHQGSFPRKPGPHFHHPITSYTLFTALIFTRGLPIQREPPVTSLQTHFSCNAPFTDSNFRAKRLPHFPGPGVMLPSKPDEPHTPQASSSTPRPEHEVCHRRLSLAASVSGCKEMNQKICLECFFREPANMRAAGLDTVVFAHILLRHSWHRMIF